MTMIHQALEVFRPGRQISGVTKFVNFDREVKVALGSAFEADYHSQRVSAVVFGYPGNGKTALARFIASRLQELSYFIVWMDCYEIDKMSRTESERIAEQFRVVLEAIETERVMVVASDLDILLAQLPRRAELAAVFHAWMTAGRAMGVQSRQLFLSTVTSPGPLLERVTPDSPSPMNLIYLDWPTEERAAEYLDLWSIPKADEVAALLYAAAEQQDIAYSNGSFIRGAAHALNTFPELDKMPVDEVAEVVSALCAPAPREMQAEYRRDNKRFILDAEATASQWDLEFDEVASSEYTELAKHDENYGMLRGVLRKIGLGSTIAGAVG